jgi:hypothetical protein
MVGAAGWAQRHIEARAVEPVKVYSTSGVGLMNLASGRAMSNRERDARADDNRKPAV